MLFHFSQKYRTLEEVKKLIDLIELNESLKLKINIFY